MPKAKDKNYYEVAVLYRDPDSGDTTEVIAPKTILATSRDSAYAKVLREIPSDYDDKIDDCEVVVQPFRRG